MQLPGMLDWYRIGLARRAAATALAPFMAPGVDRDSARACLWYAPYHLGYLATAITLLADASAPGLGEIGMGKVQEDVFAQLTGGSADDIGERICYLSATMDADFVEGCANAALFVKALHARMLHHLASGEAGMAIDLSDLEAVWRAYVERAPGLPPHE